MTISKDRVKPSPLPDSWKLREIFATGIVLGGYLGLMTVIFFWAIKETDFFPVRDLVFGALFWISLICLVITLVILCISSAEQIRSETNQGQSKRDDGRSVLTSQYREPGLDFCYSFTQLVIRRTPWATSNDGIYYSTIGKSLRIAVWVSSEIEIPKSPCNVSKICTFLFFRLPHSLLFMPTGDLPVSRAAAGDGPESFGSTASSFTYRWTSSNSPSATY